MAVPQEALCDLDSEEDKINRSNHILEIIGEHISLKGKKCLDYGCGEGHLVKALGKFTKSAMGYDIVANPYTTDLKIVKKNVPYDVVILYDVLDHAENEAPVSILNTVKSLIHDKSLVFIRFHPWTSRHGAHIYRHVNKAFAQLFFNAEELGCEIPPIFRTYYPIKTYKIWLKDSGFQIVNSKIHQTPVENFFRQQPLSSSIKNIWGEDSNQMLIDFADVVVKLVAK
jgi:2-polyprenyl-3-methyl-5-hydroxy-6-metoxy-1,4-benzoquinol methylase